MLKAIAKRLRYSQHFFLFLQIMHFKRPLNNVIDFETPPSPFNVEACLAECHCQFCSTLIMWAQGRGGRGTSNTMGSVLTVPNNRECINSFCNCL